MLLFSIHLVADLRFSKSPELDLAGHYTALAPKKYDQSSLSAPTLQEQAIE